MGAEVVVRRLDGGREHLEQVAAGVVVVELGEGGDDRRAGHLAGGVTAHPVGDSASREPAYAESSLPSRTIADVGPHRVAQSQRHRRSSSTVLPIRTGTPTGTAVGRTTLVRSR